MNFITKHIQSEFTRNVVTLFTGTSIAQAFPIIVSPILSRLYSPEDFGATALFVSITSFISIIITGQYESAIVLPKNDNQAINIAYLSFLISIGVSLLTLIVIILIPNTICNWLSIQHLKQYLFLIPISVLLTGFFQIFNYWTIRKKQYQRIAVRQISQSISTSIVKLISGILHFGPFGLIIGNIFGQFTATSVLSWITIKQEKNILKSINIQEVKNVAKKYQNFPKYNAPQAFFDSLNSNSVVFLLSIFYSNTILGYYSFAYSMVTLPIRFIGNSVTQVFYQKASESYNKNIPLWPIIKKLIQKLCLIGLPGLIIILFFGPQLFEFVFGNKWHEAGIYARILMPWLFVNFVCSPLGSIPLILNKQKNFFILTIIGNCTIPILLYFFLKLTNNQYLTLIFFSSISAVYYVIAVIWVRKIVKKVKYDI